MTDSALWMSKSPDGTVLVGVPPYAPWRLTGPLAIQRAARWALRTGRWRLFDALADELARMQWEQALSDSGADLNAEGDDE